MTSPNTSYLPRVKNAQVILDAIQDGTESAHVVAGYFRLRGLL